MNSQIVEWNPPDSKITHQNTLTVERASSHMKCYKFTVYVAVRERHVIICDVNVFSVNADLKLSILRLNTLS